MTQATLIGTRIAAGIWEGVLSGQKDAPQLEVLHLEKHLGGVEVTEIVGQPGHWAVRIQIPSEMLSDGVQTFVIRDRMTGATLSHFTVIAGLKAVETMRMTTITARTKETVFQNTAGLRSISGGRVWLRNPPFGWRRSNIYSDNSP